jgi:hypothetical protein
MSFASAVWNLYVYKARVYPGFRTLEGEQGAIRYFQSLLSVTSLLVQNQRCTLPWSYWYSSTLLYSCGFNFLFQIIQLPDDDVKESSTTSRAASTRSTRHSTTTAAAGECKIYPGDSKLPSGSAWHWSNDAFMEFQLKEFRLRRFAIQDIMMPTNVLRCTQTTSIRDFAMMILCQSSMNGWIEIRVLQRHFQL